MTLLHVATVPAPIRNFLIPYAEHFRRLGWRVEAAAQACTSVPAITQSFSGVHDVPFSRSLLDFPSLLESESRVRQLIRLLAPDIVHVHTPIASFVTRLAVRRLAAQSRPAIVYTAHGFHFHSGGSPVANAAFLAAERVAGRWTDRLVVINDEDQQAAIRHRLVPARRLVKMPGIGIDVQAYSPSAVPAGKVEAVRTALHVSQEAPLFVVVAELTRNKRHDDVLTAFARLTASDAHLMLAGDGRERARLESLASELGVRSRVHFLGQVDDVRPLYAAAAAMILASHREGLARSIMEAMAMETPVIASAARGNEELVAPDGGIVVPVGAIAALTEAMTWMIDHPAERAAMGRHGRARVASRYSLGEVLGLHELLYAGLLHEHGSTQDSSGYRPGAQPEDVGDGA